MPKKRKTKMEYRYYKMPEGSPILALLGQNWIRTYGEGIDYLHFHNYLEIGYCYEGQGELVLGEQEHRFSGNEFSIIPRNCPHTTNSDPGTVSRWEYLYIDVEGFLHELYPAGGDKYKERMIHRINAKAMFRRAEDAHEVAEKILQIMNIMRDGKEFYLEEAKGVLISLLVVLARENQEKDTAADMHEEDVGSDMIIAEALNYISKHYMDPIRIEALAQMCHVSETHFRRIFSALMNMGPLEYINMVRIQNTCELLRKTNYTVADIAYRCGFSALSTFNRNFRQAVGSSPMEWRKRPGNFEQQILQFKIYAKKGW